MRVQGLIFVYTFRTREIKEVRNRYLIAYSCGLHNRALMWVVLLSGCSLGQCLENDIQVTCIRTEKPRRK